MIELLTNPWVIIIVVLSVIIGNIAALKYTAKMKFNQMDKSRKNDLDKLNELDQERYGDKDNKDDHSR
ncbi:DUF2897 family protein [Vibrio natriegens]|uniref:DUF2897 family protein n=1 Tax=Vibrio natriegens TaxID=691 RepID=UPI0015939307|nr:DUF2897 family protein [Vibrio natriegens]NVC93664.1 DUF2897 family protein [Vibrio natriegens]